jgi:Arc/MetJ-type ribon-helix-helix transcriptional regulator
MISGWIEGYSRLKIFMARESEKVSGQLVDSDASNNASEVIREALRDSLRRERESDWLVREAAISYAHLQSGATVEVRTRDEFKNLVSAPL